MIDTLCIKSVRTAMVRLRHYDGLNTARFVTVTCHQRLRLLQRAEDIRAVLDEVDAARKKYGFLIFAYVVMPNHFHLVLYPPKPITLGSVIGEVKSRSARAILDRWRKCGEFDLSRLQVIRNKENQIVLWQRRCYDYNCRTPGIVREKIDYCDMNPVRAGLVADPADWLWSSYQWYDGDRRVPIAVDELPH